MGLIPLYYPDVGVHIEKRGAIDEPIINVIYRFVCHFFSLVEIKKKMSIFNQNFRADDLRNERTQRLFLLKAYVRKILSDQYIVENDDLRQSIEALADFDVQNIDDTELRKRIQYISTLEYYIGDHQSTSEIFIHTLKEILLRSRALFIRKYPRFKVSIEALFCNISQIINKVKRGKYHYMQKLIDISTGNIREDRRDNWTELAEGLSYTALSFGMIYLVDLYTDDDNAAEEDIQDENATKRKSHDDIGDIPYATWNPAKRVRLLHDNNHHPDHVSEAQGLENAAYDYHHEAGPSLEKETEEENVSSGGDPDNSVEKKNIAIINADGEMVRDLYVHEEATAATGSEAESDQDPDALLSEDQAMEKAQEPAVNIVARTLEDGNDVSEDYLVDDDKSLDEGMKKAEDARHIQEEETISEEDTETDPNPVDTDSEMEEDQNQTPPPPKEVPSSAEDYGETDDKMWFQS